MNKHAKRASSPFVIVDMTVDDWLRHPPDCPETEELHEDFDRWLLTEFNQRFKGQKMINGFQQMVQGFLDRVRQWLYDADHTQYKFFRNHAYANIKGHSVFVEFPFWPHDCEECHYLGREYYQTPEGEFVRFDLYYCRRMVPTVMGRYGQEGPDYVSGMALADHHPALREARKRARDLGLCH